MEKTLDLPKCNSADGRYYWMKPEVETVSLFVKISFQG